VTKRAKTHPVALGTVGVSYPMNGWERIRSRCPRSRKNS